MRRVIQSLSLSASLLAASVICMAQGVDWRQPWVQPSDAFAALTQSDQYAWRLFVALNWPAARKAPLGADAPVAWESWKSSGQVYLAGGADPGQWNLPAQLAPSPAERFESPAGAELRYARHIVNGRMVPLADPLADAQRLTEIRINRVAFEFIRARRLYSVEGQLQNYAAHLAVQFPLGAREVKAKWRPITAQERNRYHTVEVQMADGSSRLYGLTALHILSKDLPNWFWATFEHVDNARLAGGEGWQLPSRDRFACGTLPPDCNRAPAGIGLEGTVWSNYRLRGTLTAAVDAAGNPLRLANSEFERGFQTSSSCISCHARATVAPGAAGASRLAIFATTGTGARLTERRGFIGQPVASWYLPDAAGGDAPPYQTLDYVWSLSLAR